MAITGSPSSYIFSSSSGSPKLGSSSGSSSSGGSGSSSGNHGSLGCACRFDPLFDFGDATHSLSRTYRTEFTFSGDASNNNPSPPPGSQPDGTDTFYLGDVTSNFGGGEFGDIDGSCSFGVCEITSISFNCIFDVDNNSSGNKVEFFINDPTGAGAPAATATADGNLGSGYTVPITLNLTGFNQCENSIYVRGTMAANGDDAHRQWIQVVITDVS